MKKTLILASLLAFTIALPCFAEQTAPTAPPTKEVCVEKQPPADMQRPPRGPQFKYNKKAEFEKRLNLTDEQKAKAKAIREKGHQEMKPLMDKIKAKREEIKAIKLSKIAVEAQNEKINALRGELKELRKQANELRMKNMKEFESILTKKQLKELKKMKEEGRKKFDKAFRKKHGCGLKPPFPPEFGHRPPIEHGPAVPPPAVEK